MDVARFGDDATAITLGRGSRLDDIRVCPGRTRTAWVSEEVSQPLREHEDSIGVINEDSMRGGAIDELEEADVGARLITVPFGSTPEDELDHGDTTTSELQSSGI